MRGRGRQAVRESETDKAGRQTWMRERESETDKTDTQSKTEAGRPKRIH